MRPTISTTRRARWIAGAGAAVLALSSCASTGDGTGTGEEAALPAPPAAAPVDPAGPDAPADEGGDGAGALDFTATTLDGESFDAATLAGEPVVLWFWAPWCTVCRAEAPDVAQVAAELAGEVTLLGVAGRGEEEAMRGFVEDTGTGGMDHLVDADGSLWSRFGVVAQPAYAFIGPEGQAEVFGGALGGAQLQERAAALAEG